MQCRLYSTCFDYFNAVGFSSAPWGSLQPYRPQWTLSPRGTSASVSFRSVGDLWDQLFCVSRAAVSRDEWCVVSLGEGWCVVRLLNVRNAITIPSGPGA